MLDEDIGRLKYVSGAREEALRRLGIERVGDLLMHMPRRYLDFTHAYTIEQAPLGEVCTVVATVDRVREKRPRPKLSVVEVSLIDATGVLQVAFFKQPWIAQQLKAGDRLAVMGKVEFSYGFKQMSSPHYEKLDDSDAAGSILPVHPVGEGISVAWMRRIVAGALERAEGFCDLLPARLRARRHLMSASRAIRALHFPASMEERERARQRLAYDELLILQFALRLRNDRNLLDIAPCAHVTAEHVGALLSALPFELTSEQKQAVDEILSDMRDGRRIMNRLLLGDVGTGKTAVASVALAAVADTRTQACVMAPTGVLAQQYAVKTGSRARCGGRVVGAAHGCHACLGARGDHTPPRRRRTQRALWHACGAFRRCRLPAAHARGDRRAAPLWRGSTQRAPREGPGADLLVMTATPIPRTLALSVYGDLDTSVIRTRPRAGSGVETKVLSQANRDVAYGALRECLAQGQRAYVICPLVAESDDASELDDVPASREDAEGAARTAPALHSVEREVEHLRHVFPDASIRALHGRLSAAEKDAAIEAFRTGEAQVLVTTTVVEVGVDVPEATVMLIEDGERFGLATLHQLRGRVRPRRFCRALFHHGRFRCKGRAQHRAGAPSRP